MLLSQTRKKENQNQEQKKTHHGPRVGDASRLDQHIVEFGAAAAAAPAVKLLERVDEVRAQGAADAAALEVNYVLFRDEVGRDWEFFVRKKLIGGEHKRKKRRKGKKVRRSSLSELFARFFWRNTDDSRPARLDPLLHSLLF